ncbi:MAG: copper homeostasis protein CutC, partial [Melioribacteraceae bacterium]|nr:copper homeostasis protein CutC [Melioribacteraceae bacterium]
LTPKIEHIIKARKAFRDRQGLMVMIRPRSGDFSYSPQEIDQMIEQIHIAGESGADGIVLGVLRSNDNYVDTDLLLKLKEISSQYNFSVTFHRAFDATPDPLESVELLIQLGIDRILTSGTPWGDKGLALGGIDNLRKIVEISRGRIEIVIGGGISIFNVRNILSDLIITGKRISVHSYSGVQENGMTKFGKIKSLVNEIEKIYQKN